MEWVAIIVGVIFVYWVGDELREARDNIKATRKATEEILELVRDRLPDLEQ